MKIEIVLRTHDASNIHKDRERYCGFDKRTLVLGCVTSLINTVNAVSGHEFNFIILDDHSSQECINGLHERFAQSKWPYELRHMEARGYNYSSLRQFEACRDSTADIVYSVEDDYLHSPSAMQEMIDNYELFKDRTGREIVIYPFDQLDDYEPPWLSPCYVVRGTNRHWRTGHWTTATIFMRPQILKDHWPIFEELALGYNSEKHIVHEGNTLLKIWRDHALRFSPIPSLALHMQFDRQDDPYIEWESWWNEFTSFKN